MQIEKEEEVVEGVVYQYNQPIPQDGDPEQGEIARSLLEVESDSSSQVGFPERGCRPSPREDILLALA